MGRIITFYSYKGGTGRSMALANVAWILASAGHRVLAIDWDLEAPGLHRYFHPFLSDKELTGQESQGVIDMAIDFAVRSATPVPPGEGQTSEWYETYADFSKWRQKLRWPSGEAVRLGKGGKGEIDFVPAGRQGPDYAKRVNHFDWRRFYENLGGGAFFDAAKRKLEMYDYVLIDSRTGVSDTSGICTVQMPDTLVVCFTLNYQSIKGAFAVAQSVKEQRPEIRIFPVPTRVDGSEEALLNRMKTYSTALFRPLLDSNIDASKYLFSMEVPYKARYAYAEKLALFERQASISASTLPAMLRLSEYLTDGRVRSVGKLPSKSRDQSLAEFEGVDDANRKRIDSETELLESAPATVPTSRTSVRFFLAYDNQDRAVASAIADALRKLDTRFDIFLKIDSLHTGVDFRVAVTTALEEADILVVLDIDTFQRSGWSGFEVGFFSAHMRDEADTRRRVIFLSAGRPADPRGDVINYDIGIDDQTLREGRAKYVQKAVGLDDPLARFFREVTYYANELLGSTHPIERRTIDEITSTLKGVLFDNVRDRVGLLIEQRRIAFELQTESGRTLTSIPPETKLTSDSGGFEVFGFSSFGDTGTTWEDLRKAAPEPTWRAVEDVVIKAVSMRDIESTRVVIAASGRPFSVVFAKRTDFFDGRKVVVIYLLEKPSKVRYGKDLTSDILATINIAARYRAIFGPESPFSVESFALESSLARLQDDIRRLMDQILSIETDSLELGLSDSLVIRAIIGSDLSQLSRFRSLSEFGAAARIRLANSANEILRVPSVTPEFRSLQEHWLSNLQEYYRAINELESVLVVPALEVLKRTLGTPSKPSMPNL